MEDYKRLLGKIHIDLVNRKLYLCDYIRIKRSRQYHELVFKEYGAALIPIESYKYDYEVVKIVERNDYELIKVEDMISEINRTLEFFES